MGKESPSIRLPLADYPSIRAYSGHRSGPRPGHRPSIRLPLADYSGHRPGDGSKSLGIILLWILGVELIALPEGQGVNLRAESPAD